MPVMAVMLLVAMVAVVATIEIGRLLNESASARTAADAAALAGAAAGRDAAASIAAANGGVLLSYHSEEHTSDDAEIVLVTVEVKVGRASSTARAEGLVDWTEPEQQPAPVSGTG